VAAVGEPGDVADLDQQAGGAGGSDPVQVDQAGSGGLDELDEFAGGARVVRSKVTTARLEVASTRPRRPSFRE
jgi:hypothetical protein